MGNLELMPPDDDELFPARQTEEKGTDYMGKNSGSAFSLLEMFLHPSYSRGINAMIVKEVTKPSEDIPREDTITPELQRLSALEIAPGDDELGGYLYGLFKAAETKLQRSQDPSQRTAWKVVEKLCRIACHSPSHKINNIELNRLAKRIFDRIFSE